MATTTLASGPSSPQPDEMVVYGTNFCGTQRSQGPVWWQDYVQFDNVAGYTYGWQLVGIANPLGNVSAQFGNTSNPFQISNYNFGVDYWSNTLGFNLIGPVEMAVQQDVWDHCVGCTTTVRRKVTYEVVNSDGSVAANIPLGEVMDLGTSGCFQGRPSITINSCTVAQGQSIGNPSGGTSNKSGGMWATDGNGEFTDSWTMGADGYTPAGCGFAANYDHWQLCGLTAPLGSVNAGLTFATLTGLVDTNRIGINAGSKQYVLPVAIVPCPPNTPGCPGSIPVGTVFTP